MIQVTCLAFLIADTGYACLKVSTSFWESATSPALTADADMVNWTIFISCAEVHASTRHTVPTTTTFKYFK